MKTKKGVLNVKPISPRRAAELRGRASKRKFGMNKKDRIARRRALERLAFAKYPRLLQGVTLHDESESRFMSLVSMAAYFNTEIREPGSQE